MATDTISSTEAGKRVGRSRRHISELTKAGVLSYELDENGNYRYAPSTFDAEYQAHKNRAGKNDIDWNAERAKHDSRIKAATADMRELERDEMFGKYHRAEFVEDAFNEYVYAVRSAVLALPGKLAPVLAPDKKTTARYASIIESEVTAMLESLSNYEYNADYYRERLAEVTGLGAAEDE